MSTGSVVVLGDIVTDIVARLSEPLALGSDAAATVRRGGGGSPANVAAWMAVAGRRTSFVGRIGDDAEGRARAAELRDLGVDVHVAVDPEHPTGTVVVIVTPDGERTMLPDRGANLALSPADVPPSLFGPGGHLHLSAYTLFDDGTRSAGLHAMSLAREAGMTVSVDPASSQPLRRTGPARFLSWTDGADLLLPNRAEAAVLAGTDDPEEAARRLTRRYRQVVVTLGADGALCCTGDEVIHRPARPADVVDTTGAGDAFAAGFLAAQLSGSPVAEALDSGAALAAVAVARGGSRPDVSTLRGPA